ncbi:MAG: hypothetical protein ABI947_30585 [Chloroflexota bacterium]
MPVTFTIESGDITTFESDVVVLKYARSFHGADEAVAMALSLKSPEGVDLEPSIGDYRYINTEGTIGSLFALFIGVDKVSKFRYEEITQFAANAFAILAKEAPDTRYVTMTMHGVSAGLDEVESLVSQFRGCMQAIQSGIVPYALERITIIDKDRGRVVRLRQALQQYLADADYAASNDDFSGYVLAVPPKKQKDRSEDQVKSSRGLTADSETLDGRVPKLESEIKPHAFVAMPFKKEMDDVFYYGIQQPLHTTGLLCERVDQDAFTGGIMEYVRNRIETAAVIIAELTGANPNVYLEVGYAWGKGRPTILLARDEKELHFDVRGQRVLTYERIKDLEESLSKELKQMILKGIVKP